MLTVALIFGPFAADPHGAVNAQAPTIAAIASFYPMIEFTRIIGGDRVTVRGLVPPGAEAHDFEPTPRDLVALQNARLIVYNGAGFEPWIDRLLPQIPKSVVRVNATAGLPLRTVESGEERGQTDPHVWLDPVLAQRQVDNILAGVVRADPGGRAVYGANADALKARLAGLHESYPRALAGCRRKVIVVNHAAFGYLAARYGLTQIAVSGLAPQSEPSPATIREVIRLARQHRVDVVYFEALVSPRVAATVAREIGARTLLLDPIEGVTESDQRIGKDYFFLMEQNLRNLVSGLDCR